MNGGRVWWCTWHAYLNLFDMIWHVCGVGATFEDVWRRAWDEGVNVSRQREQGKRSIQQYQWGRTSWEFTGTLCNNMERCSQAEQLYEQLYGVERSLRGATFTDIRQELSWASWCEIKVMSTLRGSYGTGMRCWSAYLGWRELTAAAGWHGLEGQMGKVNRWSRRAYWARGKAISSKYQLSEHVWRVRIELPELLQGWMMFGGGWEIALTETNLYLPIYGTVLRKTWIYP